MRTYEFEIVGVTIVEVQADNYDEARRRAKELAETGKYDEALTERVTVGSGRCISEDTAE